MGSWPVAVRVAVVTSVGGRISSNASALRSRAAGTGPAQRGAQPAGHREHRPADLRRPLVVEDARARSPSPSAAPAGGRVGVGQVDRALDDRVVGVAQPVGRVVGRQVGDAQQEVAQLALELVGLVGQRGLRLRRASRLSAMSRSASSVSPSRRSRPTCFDSSLTWPAGVVPARGDLPQPPVEGCGLVDLHHQLGCAPPGDGGADARQIGAQQADVDHRRGYSPPRPASAALPFSRIVRFRRRRRVTRARVTVRRGGAAGPRRPRRPASPLRRSARAPSGDLGRRARERPPRGAPGPAGGCSAPPSRP